MNSFVHLEREYDLPFRDVVEHHFTIVFGISDIPMEKYVEHVTTNLQGQRKTSICLPLAALGDDSGTDDFYVFLTPDEGLANIVAFTISSIPESSRGFIELKFPIFPTSALPLWPMLGKLNHFAMI
ncbi:MAG: hypothetical protein R3E64_17650 [Halioglobus sp.]